MRFSSHLVRGDALPALVDEACAAIATSVPAPTVLFPFLRTSDPNDYRRLPEMLKERFPGALFFGCAANGVIGGGHEAEDGPALALTAASLPDDVTVSHIDPALFAEDEPDLAGLRASIRGEGDLLVIVDPFTVSPDELIPALDAIAPEARKLGALASGGPAPRSSMLYGKIAHRSGAVVLRVGKRVRIRPLVAQGCRPIGRAHVATHVEGPAILELDGKPAMEALQALFASLPVEDRETFRHSLFVGVEMDKSIVEMRSDRLLVRNLLGVDPQRGSIGVAADVKVFDVIQFVLRDSTSAAIDLAGLLEAAQRDGAKPAGALLFTCLGRGRHLFGRVDHDTDLFRDRFGDVALGGFFANGEIAPVGKQTFLHAYTSAFALFENT